MRDIDKFPKKAGIYKLISGSSGKIYIGKSINIYRRINYHKNSHKRGKEYHLQNAIKKYGWEDFIVEILEIFENFDKSKDNENLLQRESFYIKLFNSTNREIGYNVCEYSNDMTGLPGHKVSNETKEKLRKIHTGKKMSEESKLKMSLAKKDKSLGPRSDETKNKLRLAHTGKKRLPKEVERLKGLRLGQSHTEETKLKMRQSRLGRRGSPHSEETKEKLRQLNLGKKHSEETKEKIRQGNLGKIISEETREKSRKSNLGKSRSDETKQKMRDHWTRIKEKEDVE